MCASILIIRNFYNKAIFFGVFILFFIVLYYNYIIFNVLKLFLLYFFDSNFPVSGGPNPGKLEYLLDGKERLSPLWKGRSLFLNSEQFSPHFPAFGNLTVRFSVAQTDTLISVYCSCKFSSGNLIQCSSILTL